jgi:hypothetical protein
MKYPCEELLRYLSFRKKKKISLASGCRKELRRSLMKVSRWDA